MTRLQTTVLVLAMLAFGGCADAEADKRAPTRAAETRGSATGSENIVEIAALTVVDGKLDRTLWAYQDELRGVPGRRRPVKLAGPVHAPFTAALAPAAVPSPDDDGVVAYNSFARKRPVLRLRDLGTKADTILDVGTFSFAWGHGSGLAYFKGLHPRVRDPMRYLGHVMVRARVDAAPTRWTTEAGLYAVSAWAGNRLIVHERRQGWPDILVFDGPKRKRVLAARAGLVALSSDGAHAFITNEPNPAPSVSVVDIANGREVATFEFTDEVDPIRGERIYYVADSGAWAGETVVAAITGGLAVFRVRAGEITLEELLGVDPAAFPTGLTEPKSDETGRYVLAAAELLQKPRAAISRTALMDCDLQERICVLGRSAPSFMPPRPVYNPSRPLP